MKISILFTVLLSTSVICFAQNNQKLKTRSTLQKEFINKSFIQKQKIPLIISNVKTMDSLLYSIEIAWKNVAPDTLKKYNLDITLTEFEHFDAYNYIWLLTSMTQDLNITDRYGEALINGYMLPALIQDFELIKKNPSLANIKIIDAGSLGNTLAIGSSSTYNKKTFLGIYKAYNDFDDLVKSLPKTDTAVIAYANNQLKNINRFYYDFNARNSFYNGDLEMAYNYFITGLSINNYSADRAISFSKKLIEAFKKSGNTDKCFTLLNTLAINITADNLNRDTLLNQYLNIDAKKGKLMYDNLQEKLTNSAFKKTNITIQTPTNWPSINTNGNRDMEKVKYILIDFWYTSCGPCLAEIPELNKFYEKYKNREDILFLSVNTDYINGKGTEEYVKSRITDLNISFPVVYDNDTKKLKNQLKIEAYPSKKILNNKGVVIKKVDDSPLSLESFETLIREIK